MALALVLALAPVLGPPAGDAACLAAGGSCQAIGPDCGVAAPARPGGVALERGSAAAAAAADGALACAAQPGAPGAGWPPITAGRRGDPCPNRESPPFGPAFPHRAAARAPPA